MTYLALVWSPTSCKRADSIFPADNPLGTVPGEDGQPNPGGDRPKPPVKAPITKTNSDHGTGEETPTDDGPTAAVDLVNDVWAYQAIATMQTFYSAATSLWSNSWEGSAQSLTALVDFMKISGDRNYLGIVNNVFEKNRGNNNFIGDSFQANALWGIAWIKAYDLIGDKRYLETAQWIADNMAATGWDANCGGGLMESRTSRAKLAVPNVLFIQLMASVHNHLADDTKYIGLAMKGWNWVNTSAIITASGLLGNGLTADCQNDAGPVSTQAQGVYLGAAYEIYKANGLKEFLEKAKAHAALSIDAFTSEGILKEPGDKDCGACSGGVASSKGVFARNMRELQSEVKDDKIASFLETNINVLWNNSRSSADLLGFHWQGPFDSSDSLRQTAGVDLLNSSLRNNRHVNLALNRVAQVSESCVPTEGAVAAVDGSATTKWCGHDGGGGVSLLVDLGQLRSIKLFKVLHAGAGGEALEFNTRDFDISIGESASGPWKTIVTASDNTSSATFHPVDVKGRYIRLRVTKGGIDNVARIYEFSAE